MALFIKDCIQMRRLGHQKAEKLFIVKLKRLAMMNNKKSAIDYFQKEK